MNKAEISWKGEINSPKDVLEEFLLHWMLLLFWSLTKKTLYILQNGLINWKMCCIMSFLARFVTTLQNVKTFIYGSYLIPFIGLKLSPSTFKMARFLWNTCSYKWKVWVCLKRFLNYCRSTSHAIFLFPDKLCILSLILNFLNWTKNVISIHARI